MLIFTSSDISAWHGAGYEPLVDILGLSGYEDAEESRHIHHYVVISLGNVRDMATFVISPYITERKVIVVDNRHIGRKWRSFQRGAHNKM